MTLVDSARHEDRYVSRRCDICRLVVTYECYPRTNVNQHLARHETKILLATHIETHSTEELLNYVKQIHQVHYIKGR